MPEKLAAYYSKQRDALTKADLDEVIQELNEQLFEVKMEKLDLKHENEALKKQNNTLKQQNSDLTLENKTLKWKIDLLDLENKEILGNWAKSLLWGTNKAMISNPYMVNI